LLQVPDHDDDDDDVEQEAVETHVETTGDKDLPSEPKQAL